MIKRIIISLLLITICAPAWAENIQDLGSKQLQNAAKKATNTGDAALLLLIMKEMKHRKMLFFRNKKDPQCKREVDKRKYFKGKHPVKYSTARSWYYVTLKQIRLKEKSCDCLASIASFDELVEKRFGISFDDNPDKIIDKMFKEVKSLKRDIESKYVAFYRSACLGK